MQLSCLSDGSCFGDAATLILGKQFSTTFLSPDPYLSGTWRQGKVKSRNGQQAVHYPVRQAGYTIIYRRLPFRRLFYTMVA